MQRRMLAAVQAADWVYASLYLMQISADLAFSYIKHVLLALQNTCRHILEAFQREYDLH